MGSRAMVGLAPCPCSLPTVSSQESSSPSSSQFSQSFPGRCLDRSFAVSIASSKRLVGPLSRLRIGSLPDDMGLRCRKDAAGFRRWLAVPGEVRGLGAGADVVLGAVQEQDLESTEDPRYFGQVPNVLSLKPLKTSPLLRWRRVLLKVSGEALAGDGTANVDDKIADSISREVASITRLGVEVAIVVGGGNFFRGASRASSNGLDRASADHIGMLATVMNAIYLQSSLERVGVPTRVQTAFRMAEVAEPYIRRRAIRHLEKGRVVIFGAGTGNPFFTTDTAAALRAAEINAEVVLKATNVNGVYDCDPRKNINAKLLSHVSYREVALKKLSVMDITAITLCQENSIPVVVFNLTTQGNIIKALSGERVGTLIDHAGLSGEYV